MNTPSTLHVSLPAHPPIDKPLMAYRDGAWVVEKAPVLRAPIPIEERMSEMHDVSMCLDNLFIGLVLFLCAAVPAIAFFRQPIWAFLQRLF